MIHKSHISYDYCTTANSLCYSYSWFLVLWISMSEEKIETQIDWMRDEDVRLAD